MKLHLGVTDQVYRDKNLSTAEVAQFLENKYHILGEFVAAHSEDIQRIIESSFKAAIEEMASGLAARDPFGTATQAIAVLMRNWITKQEVETVGIKGVPTKAALEGKSSRFKSGLNGVSMKQKAKGVKKGLRRPSFYDTGLMVGSYKVWVEYD